ncbi:hypothetical protein LOOC260_109860 [Paucilactobacillus hokkaidonensis JCM 18461]|uniref:Phage gp6-like head-tail connector protein n=2 Tax=Paucilactobacillus hokkaidonensis TaxID=1193095 RepID=A0A0A1GU64_9LACO|nr:phage head-tail connector protein [Paucilactobacillus hokkaidonensis]KRO09807.1 hypothetical protein IV59_GL000421 [Paucilactobacillus hokkaidonensis]BAP85525.1 hypothetical protein LOOC260_109860 [Paucilactobacillus hokkaidonensis JCM 18461]
MADQALKNADLVQQLKTKLRIFHNVDDQRLDRMIEVSKQVIARDTGYEEIDDPKFIELVLERCRYDYNDSLEFFNANFQSNLLSLSLDGYVPSEEGETDGD